jgi:hypothetical protein
MICAMRAMLCLSLTRATRGPSRPPRENSAAGKCSATVNDEGKYAMYRINKSIKTISNFRIHVYIVALPLLAGSVTAALPAFAGNTFSRCCSPRNNNSVVAPAPAPQANGAQAAPHWPPPHSAPIPIPPRPAGFPPAHSSPDIGRGSSPLSSFSPYSGRGSSPRFSSPDSGRGSSF